MIVEKLGNRTSLIIGNIFNASYVIFILLAQNLAWLILAELISALAFGFKSIAEPALLNQSIPSSSIKGNIFSKIMGKGKAGYYYISAIATLIAGFLFEVNPYIPVALSLIVATFSVAISFNFIDVKEEKEEMAENTMKSSLHDIKIGFKFILQSGRLKGLLLFSRIPMGNELPIW